MKYAISILALAIFACAAPTSGDESSATSTEAYTNGVWQKLLTCDDGAAVLDVDTGERRNVQLVIRDENVVDYLQSKSPGAITNAKHEIVMQASEPLMNGLFAPSDFGREPFWRYNVGDFFPYAAIIRREGPGIKVILAKHFDPICEGGYWGYQGGCLGGHDIDVANVDEVANWYFHDCH